MATLVEQYAAPELAQIKAMSTPSKTRQTTPSNSNITPSKYADTQVTILSNDTPSRRRRLCEVTVEISTPQRHKRKLDDQLVTTPTKQHGHIDILKTDTSTEKEDIKSNQRSTTTSYQYIPPIDGVYSMVSIQ
jgi:hypothetical protein